MSDREQDARAAAQEEPIRVRRRGRAEPAQAASRDVGDEEASERAWREDQERQAAEYASRHGGGDDRAEPASRPRADRSNRSSSPPEKLPPSNLTAEAALLGAMLIDNRVAERERGRVPVAAFFHEVNQRTYSAIIHLIDRGMVANPVTLHPLMKDDPDLPLLGGMAYFAKITSSGAALIGASCFATQLIELHKRRELLKVVASVLDLLNDTGINDTSPAAIDMLDTAISDALGRTEVRRTLSVQDAWDEAFADLEAVSEGKEPDGILIGQYEDWNHVVGRMGPGDLIYLAGRPSMGKTAVSISVAMGAAAKMEGETGPGAGAVEYFSLEMHRKQIMQRTIANAIFQPSRTSSFTDLLAGRLTSIDRAAIKAMRAQIERYPLHISDPDAMAVENLAGEIRRRQREWQRQGRELKLVIVDYLGRLSSTARFDSPVARVSHISKVLKDMAKQCGVALVVLCQLSRAVETREDKRPLLVDLRDSGSLEQDADVVVFVHRDQYYLERSEPAATDKKWEGWHEDMRAAKDKVELIAGKRRQGALSKKTGWFFAEHQAIRPDGWQWGDDLFRARYDDD